MATEILVGTFMLLLEIGIFVMKVFLKALSYMLVFMITLVIYAVSFLLNVFTVPLSIIVHVAQKHCGGQLPYVGRRLFLFYPTFTNPKWTETNKQARREADQPVKVLVIENFNRQLRKVTKSRAIFPTDDALFKLLYLAMIDITKKWTGKTWDWGLTLDQLCIYFGDRIRPEDIE